MDEDVGRLMLKDTEVKIFILKAKSSDTGHTIFSYFGVPEMALAKLLPQKAKELGCDPRKHYGLLKNGQSVTLDDGTVIKPQMVTEKQIPSSAFAVVFLPDESYIESFLKEN